MASGVEVSGRLCAVQSADRARRALGHSWGGKASGIAKIISLSDPECLVQSHIPLKASLAFPCPVITWAVREFSVTSRLLLGLTQREHTRAQKVALDVGHLFEFQICDWLHNIVT